MFERLRFLSISASNLDEFYMVRVAGRPGSQWGHKPSIDGLTPAEQIEQIHVLASELMGKQQALWNGLREEMRQHGFWSNPRTSCRELTKLGCAGTSFPTPYR